MSRTQILVFASLLCGVLAHGVAAGATLAAPCSHTVGPTIYVAAGADDGVVEGLRCSVYSGGQRIGTCSVRSVFTTSSTIVLDGPIDSVAPGDEIRYWVESTPDTPDRLHAWARERTVEDIDAIGRAIVAYLADQARARPSSSPSRIRLARIPTIEASELRAILVPRYMPRLPEIDGWGNPYDLRLDREDIFARVVTLVRSAGADGAFAADTTLQGPMEADGWSADLVWIDGEWWRWPAGKVSGAVYRGRRSGIYRIALGPPAPDPHAALIPSREAKES